MSKEEAIAKYHQNPILVGSDGFVRLVDLMGDDDRICDAARNSYQKGTTQVRDNAGLIDYLFYNKHTSPVEMCEITLHVKVPMAIWRQWVRHRTACLSGSTELHFDLPGGIERRGNQLYKLSVKEVFDRFQPTKNLQRPDKQKNPNHKRERVQSMLIRSLNEETGTVYHTNIVDIWESGEKEVFHVKLKDNSWFECSEDHLIFTDKGWFKLKELNQGDQVIRVGPGTSTGVTPHLPEIDENSETWRSIPGWETYYEVSNQGRVRRISDKSTTFRVKKHTIVNGRAVVSLNRPGKQITAFVHQLVMRAFIGPCPDGMECCHNDGNSLNNLLDNLRWDTPQSNANDRIRDGATTSLRSIGVSIASIISKGVEMTYDLEVAGPWHNFSAGGAIVHNSINEYSTRYSEAIDDIAISMPGQWRLQSQSNKQGSDGNLYNTNPEMADALTELYSNAASMSQQAYQQACAAGVAREQARDILPLSNYTEAYWKIDLHNLFHFLRLRIDSHAQQEIREFGNAIAEIVKLWVPLAYQAWEDNIKDTLSLSSKEIELLAELIDQEKLAQFLSTEDSAQRKLLFDKLNISSQTKRISFYRKVSKLQRG